MKPERKDCRDFSLRGTDERRPKAVALAVVVTRFPAICRAATATTTFNVQITITNACTIVSATSLNFGSVGVIGASGVPSTSTINVLCTSLAPYTIGLSAGTG